VASTTVGTVRLQKSVSEFRGTTRKNSRQEQKEILKSYRESTLTLRLQKNKSTKNTVKMEKVKIFVECGKDGKFSAYMDCYDYDFGLAGFGNTAKEAIADFYIAVEEEKTMCERDGKTMPELEFDIRYDVTSFLDYYAGILSKSGLEKITGINQKQLWHYSSGKRRPTRQTSLRIQNNLHCFADNLKQVRFID